MFEAFDSLFESIGIAFEFIINLLKNLVMVVIMIGKGYATVATLVPYLPSIIQGVVFVILIYSVVINLLNKGG